MEHLEAYNRKLLANILPVHVAEHFLSVDKPVDVSWVFFVPFANAVKNKVRHLFEIKILHFSGTVSRAVRLRVYNVRVDT